jgi:hypothetical protein
MWAAHSAFETEQNAALLHAACAGFVIRLSLCQDDSNVQRCGPCPTLTLRLNLNLLTQVLFSISGCCRPGELLAFMGPSGSGKTTLLSIIGGRAQSMMRREGDVLFNGKPAEKKLKRSIGYVMQDDLLYEALTVFEIVRSLCPSRCVESLAVICMSCTSCYAARVSGDVQFHHSSGRS